MVTMDTNAAPIVHVKMARTVVNLTDGVIVPQVISGPAVLRVSYTEAVYHILHVNVHIYTLSVFYIRRATIFNSLSYMIWYILWFMIFILEDLSDTNLMVTDVFNCLLL